MKTLFYILSLMVGLNLYSQPENLEKLCDINNSHTSQRVIKHVEEDMYSVKVWNKKYTLYGIYKKVDDIYLLDGYWRLFYKGKLVARYYLSRGRLQYIHVYKRSKVRVYRVNHDFYSPYIYAYPVY